MDDTRFCVSCGCKAPRTETEFTLISARFGWRVIRVRTQDGSERIEWRCPPCWREYKAEQGVPSSGMIPTIQDAPPSERDVTRRGK